MKHLFSFTVAIIATAASAGYIRQATETYPGGGSGPTNGVTAAMVTNIWQGLAADRMVPQLDDDLAMTASESLMVSNIFQVGDTSGSLYIYEGGMAKGVQVNGTTEIDGQTFTGETIVAPGGIVTYSDDPAIYSVLTATNLVLNGVKVGEPSEYITNHANTAFIAADGTARRIVSVAKAWNPTESPRYDPPGFHDEYWKDPQWTGTRWQARKFQWDGTSWVDQGLDNMIGGQATNPNANELTFPDPFATMTELKMTPTLEYTRIAYTNDIVTSTVTTNGLASEAWVLGKNYVTDSVTNNLASETWVTNQNYVTKSVTNGLASVQWATNDFEAVQTQNQIVRGFRTVATNGVVKWGINVLTADTLQSVDGSTINPDLSVKVWNGQPPSDWQPASYFESNILYTNITWNGTVWVCDTYVHGSYHMTVEMYGNHEYKFAEELIFPTTVRVHTYAQKGPWDEGKLALSSITNGMVRSVNGVTPADGSNLTLDLTQSFISNKTTRSWIDADRNAYMVISPPTDWNPQEALPSVTYTNAKGYNRLRWNGTTWVCMEMKWRVDEWIDQGEVSMVGDINNPLAEDLEFPSSPRVATHRTVGQTMLTKLAVTNEVVTAISTNGTDYMTGKIDLSKVIGGGGGAYLPLAGGTLTGPLNFSGTDGSALKISTSTDKNYLEICAAAGGVTSHNGSFLALTGNDNPSESAANKGRFRLGVGAADGTRNIALMGYPDGRLRWNSTNVVRTVNGVTANDNGDVNITSMTNGLASEAWAKDYTNLYTNQAPNYASVSNLAANALQSEIDPTVPEAVSNALVAAKAYADELVARYHNFTPVWSETDFWALEFWLGYTSSVIGHVSTITNEAGQIISRDSIEYVFGNYADLWAELYDEYSMNPPIIASYKCNSPGGTISADGRLTVVSNGVYNCVATDVKGNQSAVDVPIQSSRQEVKEVPVYEADLPGTARKTINDDAKTVMQNATLAGTGSYEGEEYKYWNFFTQPTFAATSAGAAGNVRLFAIGTTVMASAWHYPKNVRWRGDQTVGGNVVSKGEWIHLYTWALTNGWEKAELDKMGINDIALIPLTAGTIAVTDLPYLMSEEQMAAKYKSLAGLQCWTAVQAFAQPLNRTFVSTYGDAWTYNWPTWELDPSMKPWRSDMDSVLTSRGPTYPEHSGDSGHPIYFKDENGRFILTSHYQATGGGPKYIKGFHVIKAFVEAHGGQIRELP